MNIEKVDIKKIVMNPNNPRIIKDDKFKKLVKSIKDFPEMLEVRPIVVDDNMVVLGGNMRTKACIEAGLKEVSIIKFSKLSEDKKKEFIVKDNVGYGDWDWDLLNEDWNKEQLLDWGLDLPKYNAKENLKSKLKDRFIISPFSILDTRKADWLNRKKIWNELLKEDGESREGTLASGNCVMANNNVSLFDPVLAELMFLWFCPKNGYIVDPFAGDIRKGAVAGEMGYNFTGIELRKEQYEININKIKDLELSNKVKYINDSGENVANHINDVDMILSCPPYFNLEKYSNLDNDASNQETYEQFMNILESGFSNAISKLKKNRFAVVIVGDIRDRNGYYYNFHEGIKSIFTRNGMPLYNELIMIESAGTAAMRANQLMKNRKVVKTHQNVLIFHKPDYSDDFDETEYKKIFVFYGGDIKEIKNELPSLSLNQKELNNVNEKLMINEDVNDLDNEIKDFLNE
jgi:DNA modification methylase